MSHISISLRRSPYLAAVFTVAITLTLPSVARSQQVVALVNGQPITVLDIEQRSKLIQMSSNNKAPVRKDVVDSLIDEILEIGEAKHYNIDIPDSEVNNAFANVAGRMGVDVPKLTQILANGGSSASSLKHRLKAELAWTNLVRGRYKARLEVRDSDVEAELELHKPEEKNEVGYEYIMLPIVMIVPRGSPDAAYEARKHDADGLRARFQSCASGVPFARALKDVAVRDQVTKFSADLPPQLRGILDGTEVGHLTPPEQTAEGVQMFALCTKRENKTDTPGKKEIRDAMFQKKFGAQAKRYLAEIRRGAMIEYK